MSKSVQNTRGQYSTKLREHLKKNYVQVPALSQKVSLYDYLKLARNSYYNAVKSYKNNNVQGAYVEFHKFQILVLERLPSHKDYNSNTKHAVEIRKWIQAARISAMSYLELTVDKMDADEYRILHFKECKTELDLIDEFDADDEPIVPVQPPILSVFKSTGVVIAAVPTPQDLNDRFSNLISDCDKPGFVSSHSANTAEVVKAVVVSTNDLSSSPTSSVYPSAVPDIEYPVDDFLGTDCDISQYEEHALAGLSGLSNTDAEILSTLRDYRVFFVPQPTTHLVELAVGGGMWPFHQDDFHVSFGGFLGHLPVELQMARSAVETNRCFFLHLGIATRIHPFVLQTSFRYYASIALAQSEACWYGDIVSTVNQYAGFVDANALSFLWPIELNAYVVCIVSGPLTKPILSCFAPPGCSSDAASLRGLTEIFIRCDGSHFTLLRPYNSAGSFQILASILESAKGCNMLVQFNEVQPDSGRSIENAFKTIVNY